MKKNVRLFLALLSFASMAWAQETESNALKKNPERWQAGKEMALEYNPAQTVLKGEKSIQGVIYFWQDYHWVANDLDLKQDGDVWKTTVRIPENAAFTTMKFVAGDKKDIGGVNLLYSSVIQSKEGQDMPSCYVGWALLRDSLQTYGIPDFLEKDTRRIDDEVLEFWFRNELKYHPQEQKNVLWYLYEVWNRTMPGKNHDKMAASIPFLMELDKQEPVSEEIWLKALNVSQNVLRNDSLSKVLENKILTAYPDGIMARDKELYRLFRVMDPDEKEKEFVTFLKRFPPEKFVNVQTENTFLYYGKIFQSVIYNQVIKHNNYQLLLDYLPYAPFSMLETFYWHMVQIPYPGGQVKADFILPYAEAIYNEKKSRPRTQSQMCYSPREWNERFYSEWKGALLVHAQLKNECGDPKGAILLMDTLSTYFGTKVTDFNASYVDMMEKCGRNEEVIPYIKRALKDNAASPEMLNRLKKEYVTEKKTEEGFDAYVNSLKAADELSAQRKEVLSKLVNEPIQLFAVDALEGERIDMTKMQGKIIVLDFWATWCAPCKAAMPGMQMAVNKYKDDKDVVFLFVSTMETTKNFRQTITDFIKSKGFTFQVVLDEPDPKSGKRELVYNTYARAFHFSGIPQKMIIDGKGNLRWRSLGYHGSPSALADEIGFVIDYLKAEELAKLQK